MTAQKTHVVDPPEKFADASLAREIIGQLYPSAKEVRLIEHGYDNIVGLVDESHVVRFPRTKNAWLRGQFEKEILNTLSRLRSVQIPQILEEHYEPPYSITSFLQGQHLSRKDIRVLPRQTQKDIARKVAEFAYEMHSMLSVKDAKEVRQVLGLDSLDEKPWEIHLKEMLFDYTFPEPAQDVFAKESYNNWKHLHASDPRFVVHDDIHPDNMLFEGSRLTGILDFGDTGIGTPEQEFRQLYRINEDIVRFAADRYTELSGIALNVEAIKAWAVAQELSAYAEHLIKGDTDHPAFARATNNLNHWFPKGEWGLEKGMSAEIRQ